MVCKRSENQGQLTILEKELVTGSEREELGLPSTKSSLCPLTVLIRATGSRDGRKGRGREVKDCSWGSGGWWYPHMCGGDRANQELALSFVVSPGASTVKPYSIAGAIWLLKIRIIYPDRSQAGQGWLQSRLNHVTCL